MSTYRKCINKIRVRSFLLVGLAFAALTFVVFIITVTNLSGEPVLKFEKLAIDLGEIPGASSPEIIFKFQNVGRNKLLIVQLGGSCPCQELRVTKTNLLPNEKGQLLAKLIPSNKSGPMTDKIRVYSNDPSNPITILELKRFVKQEVQVAPDTMLLDLSSGVETRQVTILGPTNDKKFKLLSANTNELPIDTNLRYLGLTKDYRRKWQIDIKVDESRIPSIVDSTGILNVTTSLSLKPLITIPIRIFNQSPITARPSSLSWFLNGKEEYAENKTVSLFYECDDIRDKKHEQLDALYLSFESHEYLQIELLEREIIANYVRWKLKISLSSDKISNSKRDKIRFDIKPINAYLDLPVAVITLPKNVKVR